jgi:Zn-dependent protease with chaperone function
MLPARTGITPVERPTEWTTAIVLLITAVIAWLGDHDTAALVAVLLSAVPVIVTAVVSWWDRTQEKGVEPPVLSE